MEVIYGTSNKNKVKDMEKIMQKNNFNAKIYSLKDIGLYEEIIEDGKTFEENSKIKAHAVYNFCKRNNINYDYIITDDAGLCVDALNGEPGIYSARWLGENATQEEILNHLIDKMKDKQKIEDRTAKFVCVLTLIKKDGKEESFRGECLGHIGEKYGKLGGLTYSPLFIPNGFDKPMSDLNVDEYENAHNHRAIAFNKLVETLKKEMNK